MMERMRAKTRSRFMLSSKELYRLESQPLLTPRENLLNRMVPNRVKIAMLHKAG